MVILREKEWDRKGDFRETGKKYTKGEVTERRTGIAVDIGTTTVVLYLADLRTGKVIGRKTEENVQTALGADVMMRIMHAVQGKQDFLHQQIVSQIERMAASCMEECGEKDSEICIVVAGNTTMCHLFLNKDVSGLAGAPFQSAYSGSYLCNGLEIGMKRFKEAKIQVLPGIASHVGSDALAGFYAQGENYADKAGLYLDLGTNAEIIGYCPGKMCCCSAAAGPALEGKGIARGKKAMPGVVTGIRMASNTGNIILEYIRGGLPRGISGSGLLDALECLRKVGVLDSHGYLYSQEEAEKQGVHSEFSRRLQSVGEERGFCLWEGTEEVPSLMLLQSDIRNLQLAKGAIFAGIKSILEEMKTDMAQLEEVIVAGALGSHIREETALRIGLFPVEARGKLRFVGNAAGKGALLALCDEEKIYQMENLANRIEHLELADSKNFSSALMEGMELAELSVGEKL